jgi:PleD family two-component response regulator
MDMRPKTILIADESQGIPALRLALGDAFDVTVSTSFTDALHQLDIKRFDAILCGLHFDEGRMFDLLNAAKTRQSTKDIPFVCINALNTVLSDAVIRVVEVAANATGTHGFIEFSKWRKELGDEAAFAKLRTYVADLP